jgi:hypothetical protein
MTFSTLNNSQTAWYQENRPGHAIAGSSGTALISDLIVNDYLVGTRARVVSTGTTTSGVRTLTLERLGIQFTVGWVATSSVIIIRP